MLRIPSEVMTAPLTKLAGRRDLEAQIWYWAAVPFLNPVRSHRIRRLPFPFRDALRIAEWAEAQDRRRRGRRRKDLDDGGVPVAPNKPRNLSGGAAAALEFEDDGEP